MRGNTIMDNQKLSRLWLKKSEIRFDQLTNDSMNTLIYPTKQSDLFYY